MTGTQLPHTMAFTRPQPWSWGQSSGQVGRKGRRITKRVRTNTAIGICLITSCMLITSG